MTRVATPGGVNAPVWATLFAASWFHGVPERLVIVVVIGTMPLAWPAGCCGLPWLIQGQFHDLGWRFWLYGAVRTVKCVIWV